jgi:hypothetical protein
MLRAPLIAGFAVAFLATGVAVAQPTSPPDTSDGFDSLDENEDELPLVPPAADRMSGHLGIAPMVAWAAPFGSPAADIPDRVGPGLALSLDAGIGVSRTVMVGAWGQFQSLGNGADCGECTTTGFAGGAFIRYHLVQGLRFDPWFSAGLGFRSQTTDLGSDSLSYAGIEWLRLQVGGDWYPIPQVGFGPAIELDMGVFTSRPDGEDEGAAHWTFITGFRITYDPAGH